MSELTPKAERTREMILNTALDLFAKKGYEATTMRDIASAAGASTGLTYRYYESKEALVLALYQRMAEETDAAIAALPSGSAGTRFVATMNARLAQAEPYRGAFGALFGTIMTPDSGTALFGEAAASMRQRAEDAFKMLILSSSDAPNLATAGTLAKLFSAVHFGVILFWLHDQSEGFTKTRELLKFIQDSYPLFRQIMKMPGVSRMIRRLVSLLESII